MLKADSSAEKSDSELQSSATAPTTESVVAFRCTASTTLTIDSTRLVGEDVLEVRRRARSTSRPGRGSRASRARGRSAGRTTRARSTRPSPRGGFPARRRTGRALRPTGPHAAVLLASAPAWTRPPPSPSSSELSTQVVEVVVIGQTARSKRRGRRGDDRAGSSPYGAELLAAAAAIRDGPAVERVQVELDAARSSSWPTKARLVVATTVAEPTAGLVAYDLRTAARKRLREDGP